MDAAPRKIEIFAPLSAAFDLTRRILFQPFDLAKWLTIAFAAFLAGLADGTRGNFNFRFPDFTGRAQTNNVDLEAVRHQIDLWLVGGVIIAVVIAVVVLVVVCLWVGSRGRFMFIDCIVHNRGAIEAPWREYRREGNSLFLWSLALAALSLLVTALLALPFIAIYLSTGEFPEFGAGLVIYAIAAAVALIIAGLAVAVITWFMVPVMYRQRCSARAAFMKVIRLILSEPAPFILYVLMSVVVLIGGTMLSCVVTCVTCCIAALPYVGTVILLPLYMFYYSFALLFLRQFGPEYDVWATIVEPAAPPPSAEPPADPSLSEPPVTPPAPGEPPPLQA